tara:strand:+ start:792 stop:1142 length:351 start_codon:yes stop_codon:yes gene_type:complete
MERFNKYDFISDLKDSIGEFIEDSEFEDDEDITDEMQEFIDQQIQNEIMYYYDCWKICSDQGCSDFYIEETGETAKNITELAYWTLWDIVQESIDYHLETKELQEKLKDPETFKHF